MTRHVRRLRWPLALAIALVVLVAGAAVGWVGVDRGWFGGAGDGCCGAAPVGLVPTPTSDGSDTSSGSSAATRPTTSETSRPDAVSTGSTTTARPLKGKVVVIDPGHQLGNHNYPDEIGRPVDAGGFDKPCNTTGTATNAGYPEATFTWQVASDLRRLLRREGARVALTRSSNSESAWGPCVDVRGRTGNPGAPGPTADVKLSIHADGSLSSGAHGFHVIAPKPLPGLTEKIAAPSLDLAETLRNRMVAAGFSTATYTAVHGIDVRDDLGTLNWSERPVAMIECGNMRDPDDAALLTSRSGQHRIARALADGLERYLTR